MSYKLTFLDAPKIKRTHCYICVPSMYEIECPICGATSKITWSEFEKHLWCYTCEKDIYLDLIHSGIFSGPIPYEIATTIFGMSFDRVNIETGDILKFDISNSEDANKAFNDTFIKDEELIKFEEEFEDKLRAERLEKITRDTTEKTDGN